MQCIVYGTMYKIDTFQVSTSNTKNGKSTQKMNRTKNVISFQFIAVGVCGDVMLVYNRLQSS